MKLSFFPILLAGTLTLHAQDSIQPSKTNKLATVYLKSKGNSNLVTQRATPIASSTIYKSTLNTKLGNQEFVEILKTTPSIYATKGGGGFGDSRVNLRGFDQSNTSFMFNGQPLNDLQGGWVYWSNWLGIFENFDGIQVQRGLGNSRIGTPSVGGTINIVSNYNGAENAGSIKSTVGNDGFLKTTIKAQTEKNKLGWYTDLMYDRWQGDGYVNGTTGKGDSYAITLGYQPSKKHNFYGTFLKASQWHHRRAQNITLDTYLMYEPYIDMRKFNTDWGYLNGKEYSFKRNFYTKPMVNLNWDYQITKNLELNNTAYHGKGSGGETYNSFGNNQLFNLDGSSPFRDSRGIIDVNSIITHNQQTTGYTGSNGFFTGKKIGSDFTNTDGIQSDVIIQNAYINTHTDQGIISNLTYKNKLWTFGGGIHLRDFVGYNFGALNDLLGLDGYYTLGNNTIISETVKATPNSDIHLDSPQKQLYHTVAYMKNNAFNGILEYHQAQKTTAVFQFGISEQSYSRAEYMYSHADIMSDTQKIIGGFGKIGTNYNINRINNLFFNVGKVYRQPFYNSVFQNNNTINTKAKNEEITSFELGYGIKKTKLQFDVNAYSTLWTNRFLSKAVTINSENGTATFENLAQLHQGIELETIYKISPKAKLAGMLSVGNWRYTDNVTANVYNNTQQFIGTSTMYVKDTKVGNAAQTTANINAAYLLIKNLWIDANWNYNANLYADFNVTSNEFFTPNNKGALQLPNYHLFDLGVNYHLPIAAYSLDFNVNVNNIFDSTYIAESLTNTHVSNTTANTYKGIDTSNAVWFGFGRTWNSSIKFNF